MDYASANGVRIACRADGEPGRPAVVLSNSLATDHRMWDAQMPALLPAFRVIRYDKRGHGASDAPAAPYTIETLARDCLAVLDRYGIEKAHFVGLSIGGMAGQWLGARAADRFLSLTLCDTASEMPPGVWDERLAKARAEGMEALVESTVARWFTEPFRAQEPPVMALVREMIAGTSVEGYTGCGAAIRDMALTPLLAEIALPTLIVVGAEDSSTPVSVAESLAASIRRSELAVIPAAAHLPNIERPGPFNQALTEFLKRQAGQPTAT